MVNIWLGRGGLYKLLCLSFNPLCPHTVPNENSMAKKNCGQGERRNSLGTLYNS